MSPQAGRLTVRDLRALLDELLDDRMIGPDTLIAATIDPEGNGAHPLSSISRGATDKRGAIDIEGDEEFTKDDPADVLVFWAGY